MAWRPLWEGQRPCCLRSGGALAFSLCLSSIIHPTTYRAQYSKLSESNHSCRGASGGCVHKTCEVSLPSLSRRNRRFMPQKCLLPVKSDSHTSTKSKKIDSYRVKSIAIEMGTPDVSRRVTESRRSRRFCRFSRRHRRSSQREPAHLSGSPFSSRCAHWRRTAPSCSWS